MAAVPSFYRHESAPPSPSGSWIRDLHTAHTRWTAVLQEAPLDVLQTDLPGQGINSGTAPDPPRNRSHWTWTWGSAFCAVQGPAWALLWVCKESRIRSHSLQTTPCLVSLSESCAHIYTKICRLCITESSSEPCMQSFVFLLSMEKSAPLRLWLA